MIDISSLRERSAKDTYSVTELNNFIKNLFDSNRTLSAISVTGEISNLTDHRSGHLYFSLKDSDAQIKAVMFRSQRAKIAFTPENGMKVTVRGSISIYPQTGTVQLYATSMSPDGIGALYKAYEQLKERLFNEGLFSEEHKNPLPRFPLKIGVITSPSGAAVRDIINVTGRRFPLASIYLYPSLVQGDLAEDSLIKALDYFNRSRLVDVIIIGRGGGSIEDLWAFNGERLARKIYECSIPIISAVGHETDFTICDFVSDLRAPTPSAAAEIAVPDIRDISVYLDSVEDRMCRALRQTAERKRERLLRITEKELFSCPETIFDIAKQSVSDIHITANDLILKKLTDRQSKLQILIEKANALSPLSVLSRGYSVTELNGKTVRNVDSLKENDVITIKFTDGTADATVLSVNQK